jgi:hypothetical protein
VLLADGSGGARDDAGARSLFEKAAAQNHPRALERMGAFAEDGRGGPQDKAAAKALLRASRRAWRPRCQESAEANGVSLCDQGQARQSGHQSVFLARPDAGDRKGRDIAAPPGNKPPPTAIGERGDVHRTTAMIRKLQSGEYRLYSRKVNPKTGKRRNLGTFKSRAAAENTSATCSISSGISLPKSRRSMRPSIHLLWRQDCRARISA